MTKSKTILNTGVDSAEPGAQQTDPSGETQRRDRASGGGTPDEPEYGVGLLFSAPDDFPTFRNIMKSLQAVKIPYDYYAAAMFREPGGIQQWAQFAEWRRLRVIIAAAGREPMLPWMAAEQSLLPVIALPISQNGRPPDLPANPPQVPVIMAPLDEPVMAQQMALRILALRNARARTIVAAIQERRATTLQSDLDRIQRESRDLLQTSIPPEQLAMRMKMEMYNDMLEGELKEPEMPKTEQSPALKAKSEKMDSEAKETKKSKSKAKKAGEVKGDPKENQSSEKKADKPPTENIDHDFDSYKEVFMQEISKIRVEVQQTRNPEQKKFEEEARREREAAKKGKSGGKESAPLRRLRDYGGPIEGLVSVNSEQPQLEIIEAATAALAEGHVIAIPTDTVYGLAVDATNADAVRKLYDLKGREDAKAIPLLIHSIRMLESICPSLTEDARKLAKAFWPGPLTLVVPRHTGAFEAVTKDATIGVRLPDHFVALSVISMVGRPLAVTSANPSGAKPAESGAEVGKYFGAKLKLILDSGPAPGGPVSTVLKIVDKPFEILREGKISREQLERVVMGKVK